MHFEFPEGHEPLLSGDIHFVFKHRGVLTHTAICRIAFNTSFLSQQNSICFTKFNVSPDKTKKDPRFQDNFLIKFIFEDYCSNCNKP
jgi:hypothetical protein